MTPSRNPVYGGYLADPFVWQYEGIYYAVGTGALEAMGAAAEATKRAQNSNAQARLFTLLRSEDLVNWQDKGGALIPPDPAAGDQFSGPEVAQGKDGRWYLYYSVGKENQVHRLHVAISDRPEGPYEDTGVPLTGPELFSGGYFANDPHPFHDPVDDQWYLFYARDFLDGERAGTGLAADRLIGMTRLAGEERVVLRPRFDWHRFDAQRQRYGRAWDWFQAEGPFVRRYQGRYWCLYSGGSWQSTEYSVDWVVADRVCGPYDYAGSENGPRLLCTPPEGTPGPLGPGHCSVFTATDGTEYLAYHAWDASLRERRLWLDPLHWTAAGPRMGGDR